MKKYKIFWVDKVTYSVEVEADSEEEALKIANEGTFSKHLRQEEDVEFIEEPWIEE